MDREEERCRIANGPGTRGCLLTRTHTHTAAFTHRTVDNQRFLERREATRLSAKRCKDVVYCRDS
jgi:hypothetical protein